MPRAAVAWVIVLMGTLMGCIHPAPAVPAGASVYWCPMHPEVRGRAGDRCPICGMTLVRGTTAAYTPYVVDFDVTPRALSPGQTGTVRFYVRDPQSGATITKFETIHERIFHLFIVSQDLEYFEHVHPRLEPDGALDIDLVLPRPGRYELIGDFLPTGGQPQIVQKALVTAGYSGSLIPRSTLAEDTAVKTVEGTRITPIVPPPIAGREQLMTFEVADAETGAAVSDLEPYLGAAGHLLIVSADLTVAAHSHPVAELSASGGPRVVFQVIFPRAGDYRIWVQLQRRGRVLTAPFTIHVAPAVVR